MEEKRKAEAEADEQRRQEFRKKPGKPAAPITDDPDPKAQKNFTDPESRIMKTKDGYIQGYNDQAAVDGTAQVIVAHDLDARPNDKHQLLPMTDPVIVNMGAKPDQLSADSGFCSEPNLAGLEARAALVDACLRHDGYIATGRAKHAVGGTVESETPVATVDAAAVPAIQEQMQPEPVEPPTRVEAIREKIRAGGHESPYRFRKQLPEPVFGQIKQARGFRQLLLRGFENVAAEWALVCTAHNLLKLAAGIRLASAA